MNCEKGYIYIRCHPSYDIEDACKLGKAKNIPERDTQYATGEIKRGQFEMVFEVSGKQMDIIERLLQNEFCDLNIKYNAGTEFYNKQILILIEPYLIKMRIHFKKLSKEEINKLVRCNRVRHRLQNINISLFIRHLKSHNDLRHVKKQESMFLPRQYQQLIIAKTYEYFQQQNKGLLVVPCGVGKTLISLWIASSLDVNTLLVGVPNKLLLKQWQKVTYEMFAEVPSLIVSGGKTIQDICEFLQMYHTKCIVITTYSSAHKVFAATKQTQFQFELKINDEAHHLTSHNMMLTNTTKTYSQMLHILSSRQLSLTATIKLLDCPEENNHIVVSNDNLDYFGEIIDKRSLLWAIRENIVCDYMIQTIVADEEHLEQFFSKFQITKENEKQLFLGAYVSLQSIVNKNSHHLLIYCNTQEHTDKYIQYVKMLLEWNYFHLPTMYFSNYNSDMTTKKQKQILVSFGEANMGILACVYCLGEGWDFPLLDGVVFVEKMSSTIRIVQSALRASRKNNNEPNKITKIILPIRNTDDWLDNNNNSDFQKIREVIYQIGLEDETIAQKIRAITLPHYAKAGVVHEQNKALFVNPFDMNDDTLTQQIKLKTVKRIALGISYEKAKQIIAQNNVKTKKDYIELCQKDLRLSINPEIIYQSQFTNWIDYLSVQGIYYDLKTCKQKICEYLTLNPELKSYYLFLSELIEKLCDIDPLFPPVCLWLEYYNIPNLQQLFPIMNVMKKRKRSLIL